MPHTTAAALMTSTADGGVKPPALRRCQLRFTCVPMAFGQLDAFADLGHGLEGADH